MDTLTSKAALGRPHVDNSNAVRLLETEPRFGPGTVGRFSLELWQQRFHDRSAEFSFAADEAVGRPA